MASKRRSARELKGAKSARTVEWFLRLIGAHLVGAIAFFAVGPWFDLDLSRPIRLVIASAVGILFFFVGGSIWRWIEELDFWT